MLKSPEEIVEKIQYKVKRDIGDILNMLSFKISETKFKDEHSKAIAEAWKIVEKFFYDKWKPALNLEEEENLITYLKKKMSLHSVKDLIKQEFKENIANKLGIDVNDLTETDPDEIDKIDELSFESNIAYTTLLSIINENLEIFLARVIDDEENLREEVEDFWLKEVYERIMIEYIQYGKNVVEELDEYAISKNFFEGFAKGMIKDIYRRLFEEKLNELKQLGL